MPQTMERAGITFAVDDVLPATEPLPEHRARESFRLPIDEKIEGCSDQYGTVVREHPAGQALLSAVHRAFSDHRPLVLTPDAVWITITQGVAHHMAVNGEAYRSRFVEHQGKLELVFKVSGWHVGSPDNPWSEAFDGWAGLIREHVGVEMHDALLCDFSTTGPVERAVSQIVMMDIFERFFSYTLQSICGIPTVTLEGTTADWQHLTRKTVALERFGLSWWLDHLVPICEQFEHASRGDIDYAHWRDICKLQRAYGGALVNGWVAKLFPYLRKGSQGPCVRRNPVFETGEGFATRNGPSGLSHVRFKYVDVPSGSTRDMEATAGFLGMTQDPKTLALRPKAGWAVWERLPEIADQGAGLPRRTAWPR